MTKEIFALMIVKCICLITSFRNISNIFLQKNAFSPADVT